MKGKPFSWRALGDDFRTLVVFDSGQPGPWTASRPCPGRSGFDASPVLNRSEKHVSEGSCRTYAAPAAESV